jgi:hypothetical protein
MKIFTSTTPSPGGCNDAYRCCDVCCWNARAKFLNPTFIIGVSPGFTMFFSCRDFELKKNNPGRNRVAQMGFWIV